MRMKLQVDHEIRVGRLVAQPGTRGHDIVARLLEPRSYDREFDVLTIYATDAQRTEMLLGDPFSFAVALRMGKSHPSMPWRVFGNLPDLNLPMQNRNPL